MFRVVLLILSAVAFTAHADYPTSFSNAKSKAEKKYILIGIQLSIVVVIMYSMISKIETVTVIRTKQ